MDWVKEFLEFRDEKMVIYSVSILYLEQKGSYFHMIIHSLSEGLLIKVG